MYKLEACRAVYDDSHPMLVADHSGMMGAVGVCACLVGTYGSLAGER